MLSSKIILKETMRRRILKFFADAQPQQPQQLTPAQNLEQQKLANSQAINAKNQQALAIKQQQEAGVAMRSQIRARQNAIKINQAKSVSARTNAMRGAMAVLKKKEGPKGITAFKRPTQVMIPKIIKTATPRGSRRVFSIPMSEYEYGLYRDFTKLGWYGKN